MRTSVLPRREQRAKAGEEDAIIALHEDWQRKQGLKARVYLSWELLRNIEAPREFIVIAHFESEERAMADELNQDAWYSRLVSLIEEKPACIYLFQCIDAYRKGKRSWKRNDNFLASVLLSQH